MRIPIKFGSLFPDNKGDLTNYLSIRYDIMFEFKYSACVVDISCDISSLSNLSPISERFYNSEIQPDQVILVPDTVLCYNQNGEPCIYVSIHGDRDIHPDFLALDYCPVYLVLDDTDGSLIFYGVDVPQELLHKTLVFTDYEEINLLYNFATKKATVVNWQDYCNQWRE